MKNKDKIPFYEGLACAFRSWMTSTLGFDEVRKVMLQRAMELKDDKLFCGLVVTYYRLLNEEHERDLSFIENSIETTFVDDRYMPHMYNDSDKYAKVIYDILRDKVTEKA